MSSIKQLLDTAKAVSQGFAHGQMVTTAARPVDSMGYRSRLVLDIMVEHARRTNKPIIYLNMEAT